MVRHRFAAASGRRVQFDLNLNGGDRIPFGAQAYDEQEKVIGMVDNLSRLLVFGLKDQGRLEIRWGEGACQASYQLPPRNKDLAYERVALVCRKPSA
ncbi:Outer membrane usher protein HtrE [compost metagenome]